MSTAGRRLFRTERENGPRRRSFSSSKTENPIVGSEARNQAIIEPRRTVRFVKREMGNPSYRVNIDGKDYFPEDLSAMILKKLKNDAEASLGREINKAVISVPAYFKDAQREATRQAGEIAGLEVIRM